MSDQLLGILIPAITTVLVALIGAFVAVSGRGRDLAVLQAMQDKEDENRRLAEENRQLREDEE